MQDNNQTTNGPIMVYRFEDAPQHLQDLSTHGGDEDWLAVVPPHLADEYIGWLEHGSFGVCDISEHPMDDGSVIKIGAHA